MGFGISSAGTNQQTRTTNESVEYDELLNSDGEIQEMRTAKHAMEMTEDFMVPKSGTISDAAVSGQVGTRIVTGFNLTEEAGKYNRYSVTTRHGGTAVGISINAGTVTITGGTTATA